MAQDVVAILKAADITTTVDWYRSAGFDIRHSEPTWCEVARAGLALQFLSGETPWSGPPSLTGCFYVQVSDVDAVADDLRGTITSRWGAEDRDWGSRELVLQDPDGYFITFTTPRHEPRGTNTEAQHRGDDSVWSDLPGRRRRGSS